MTKILHNELIEKLNKEYETNKNIYINRARNVIKEEDFDYFWKQVINITPNNSTFTDRKPYILLGLIKYLNNDNYSLGTALSIYEMIKTNKYSVNYNLLYMIKTVSIHGVELFDAIYNQDKANKIEELLDFDIKTKTLK